MIPWREKQQILAAGCFDMGRSDEMVVLAETVDGNEVGLPVITVKGQCDGPRVWIQAETHGDEANATAAILQVLGDLEVDAVSGVIVAAPVVHVTAFRHFSRESPLDGKNGNRIWGEDWSRLGHTRVFSYIWMHRVLGLIRALRPHLVVDMHDGGIPLNIISHVLYSSSAEEFAPDIQELSAASGMKVVWRHEGELFGGSINSQMCRDGVPCLTLEAGGTGRLVPSAIDEMARGLRNVLVAKGVLRGELAGVQREQIFMTRGNWVRAGRAGLFLPEVELGDRVKAGSPIGRIVSVFGKTLERILAPVDGLVFGLRSLATANMGDYVANVGKLG